jgi:hypothetical protein
MAINNDEKRPPLVATLAEAVVREGAELLQHRVPLNTSQRARRSQAQWRTHSRRSSRTSSGTARPRSAWRG